MRQVCVIAVLLSFAGSSGGAPATGTGLRGAGSENRPQPHGVANQDQQDNGGQAPTTLTVESRLVEVPVLVKTKSGQVVFALTAKDFAVSDDGAPQTIRLEEDTDREPLALAVVVETGGAGARHLADYEQLDAILDALVGNVEHRVALIGFDSKPHLVVGFTHQTDAVSEQLSRLNPGDAGAAILDGVAKAVEQLKAQPPRFRRAILLLSETRDGESKTTLHEALRMVSDANITIYSFGFSSTGAAVAHEASKFNRPDEPGPAHGCFSRDGTDPVSMAEYQGHYSKQVLDCISDLAPPVRLATMAWIAAAGGLRKNTAESIAGLTGGEYFHFHNARDLKAGLARIANDVPNYYVLSFRPTDPTPGLHALRVELFRSDVTMRARTEYWVDEGER
ncbi:MAG TPA: VWA domain-containing protein [Acidobacteriaceae bacterium]|nr:VWA domain-containing protein [Acidobacteriaceae bacterium]